MIAQSRWLSEVRCTRPALSLHHTNRFRSGLGDGQLGGACESNHQSSLLELDVHSLPPTVSSNLGCLAGELCCSKKL